MKRAGLVLVLALLGAARAQDAEADAAACELIASRVFATGKLPAEQWLGNYGGSCFVSAVKVSVLEKDEAVSGLRRIEILRVFSREKENPRRNVERWWFDEKGLVVLGEKRFYDEPGKEDAEPRLVTLYRFKNGKVTVRDADQPEGETQDVPAGFVPDAKLAILF
ncbi:MAG TPA: hypothetical protein VFF73_38685, partial [Planctomycetota bacterium]|nr:hypothetical protein [Planctomycetota bacterium]